MALTDDVLARFSRQLLVAGFGEAALQRLLASRVRVVGAAAAAGPALVVLVQAGVGRIWIDDADAVAPADLGAWLYPPTKVGAPRAAAAAEALAERSRYAAVEPYPAGGVPTAALVTAPPVARGLAAAEAARRARIPHVVAEVDGDGGAVVSIPPGAPCYACARSTEGGGRPPALGAAALGALAAGELLQLIVAPEPSPGRRIDLVRGIASSRATLRLAGCACGAGA